MKIENNSLSDPPEEINESIIDSIAFETKAIIATHENKYQEAINLFQAAIDAAPFRPSVYNNRAQTMRLLNDDAGALSNLNKALELAPAGRTKCQALCQRGLLFRKQEKINDAKLDFTEAAKLGSKFARSQLIEINPYAALCNQMLREAFDKLK
ncbi:Tetratricopeptide repeat protein 36 like [Pseudolycoriella hygida]|uniref:Tetratricopeptide repeat protein 36 like n=1 Tax=Pseudolycoriella hygida TaxID=35572 RepID=A0A9Q0S933_9DIPT|nr:Tetratricopeptide repeat protein 36 like [Pseudolycoriella hygida]